MYMCSVLDPMAQDIPEQDIVMGELELPPQMDPKPEMGAAAAEAAVYDTSPSLLRNPPPIPAETVRPGTPDMAQICAMLAVMSANMETNTNEIKEGMNEKLEGMNANMERRMDGMARTMREEMQCMGAGLQGGTRTINPSTNGPRARDGRGGGRGRGV